MQGQEALFSSESMEWGTPWHIFEDLHKEHLFYLDVCATPENAKLPLHFGWQDNGTFIDAFSRNWYEYDRAFMNPPYGRGIDKWMEKAFDEAQKGLKIVCLIPARTDTSYWHDYVMTGAHDIQFVKGRIKFEGTVLQTYLDFEDLDEQGQPKEKKERVKATNSATFPSAIVTFDGPMGGRRRVRSYTQPSIKIPNPSL